MSKVNGEFAKKWIDAWNSHDVEAVLDHYVNDCEFVSPKAAAIVGTTTGAIAGKAALRAYWTMALAKYPALHFSLRHAVYDEKANAIAIIYEVSFDPGAAPPVLACEVLTFGGTNGEDGDERAVRGEAFYGATL